MVFTENHIPTYFGQIDLILRLHHMHSYSMPQCNTFLIFFSKTVDGDVLFQTNIFSQMLTNEYTIGKLTLVFTVLLGYAARWFFCNVLTC